MTPGKDPKGPTGSTGSAERAKVTADRNIPAFDDLPVPADTANLRKGANLNDAMLPLVGVWRGEGEGRGPDGDYRFGQQIVVSHDGGDYLNWGSPVLAARRRQEPGLRETGYWRFVRDPDDPSESQAIELLLAHLSDYIELFYGRPRNQSSYELVTDALARSRSGVLVGGAKRLYGIVEGRDLAYVEERVDAGSQHQHQRRLDPGRRPVAVLTRYCSTPKRGRCKTPGSARHG